MANVKELMISQILAEMDRQYNMGYTDALADLEAHKILPISSEDVLPGEEEGNE